ELGEHEKALEQTEKAVALFDEHRKTDRLDERGVLDSTLDDMLFCLLSLRRYKDALAICDRLCNALEGRLFAAAFIAAQLFCAVCFSGQHALMPIETQSCRRCWESEISFELG